MLGESKNLHTEHNGKNTTQKGRKLRQTAGVRGSATFPFFQQGEPTTSARARAARVGYATPRAHAPLAAAQQLPVTQVRVGGGRRFCRSSGSFPGGRRGPSGLSSLPVKAAQ